MDGRKTAVRQNAVLNLCLQFVCENKITHLSTFNRFVSACNAASWAATLNSHGAVLQPHAPLSRRAVQCPSANVGDHSSVLKLSHPSWCGMPETRNQVHARHPMHPLLQQPAINHEEKDPLASTTHQSGKPQWDHLAHYTISHLVGGTATWPQ